MVYLDHDIFFDLRFQFKVYLLGRRAGVKLHNFVGATLLFSPTTFLFLTSCLTRLKFKMCSANSVVQFGLSLTPVNTKQNSEPQAFISEQQNFV